MEGRRDGGRMKGKPTKRKKGNTGGRSGEGVNNKVDNEKV